MTCEQIPHESQVQLLLNYKPGWVWYPIPYSHTGGTQCRIDGSNSINIEIPVVTDTAVSMVQSRTLMRLFCSDTNPAGQQETR